MVVGAVEMQAIRGREGLRHLLLILLSGGGRRLGNDAMLSLTLLPGR
jgi:hypothetical protein